MFGFGPHHAKGSGNYEMTRQGTLWTSKGLGSKQTRLGWVRPSTFTIAKSLNHTPSDQQFRRPCFLHRRETIKKNITNAETETIKKTGPPLFDNRKPMKTHAPLMFSRVLVANPFRMGGVSRAESHSLYPNMLENSASPV